MPGEEKSQGIHKRLGKEAEELRKSFLKETLQLATSGFGLVAALAWNEVIKDFIETYVQPFFGKSSGLVSRFIYAVVITLFAVLVTYNLTKLAEKSDGEKNS